ncbi:MAG TPA: hypothetical protein PLI09_00235 [Candidatus Hydrogenedentes bacterium]|nr:hypothetical protein [Candidatus Hydrogenedentota bacterium]
MIVSQPHTHNQRYPWRKRRRRVLLALFLLVVLLGGGLAVFNWKINTRTEAMLKTLQASGIPTTPKELENQYPAPPQGKNAAETYQKAFETGKYDENAESYAKIDDKMREESKDSNHQPTLSDTLRSMVREYLNANAETLRLLHEAAKTPGSRYPLDFSDPINMKLDHLAKIRQSLRLLKLEAMLAADDKDFDKALEAIRAMLAAGDSVRQEPIFISQLVRNACHGLTVDALQYVLASGTLTEEQLARLNDMFTHQIDTESFTRGLQGEYIVGMAVFDRPEIMADLYKDMFGVESYVPGATRTLLRVVSMTGWTEADRYRYLSRLSELNAISRMPVYEAIPAMQAFEDQIQRNNSWIPTISGNLSSGLSRAVFSFGRDQAQIQFATTAIAIQRYQSFTSKLPDSLNDLVPSFMSSMPQDPFDGQPMRYRRIENGYLVYSVGYNQQDEGGVAPAENQDRYRTGDIIFTLEH